MVVRTVGCAVAISVAVFLSCAAGAEEGSRSIPLIRAGKPVARIVVAPADRAAAAALQRHLRARLGLSLEVVEPSAAQRSPSACDILLGAAGSNSYLKQVAARHGLEIDPAGLTNDGYVLHTLHEAGGDRVLLAGGGTLGLWSAVGELKNYYLRATGEGPAVLPAAVREVPTLKHRWFWTWDYRMAWDGRPGGQAMGSRRSYDKPSDSFVADYKACLDYMAENGLNGLIIWGFISPKHGGEAASREVCRYAVERGVRILPGVGTSAYWGYVVEGDHPYHADTWLRQHPELAAVRKTRPGLCPSKKANQEWLDEGARWLFENFPIGGVNLEMGDRAVCRCPDCQAARKAIDCDYPDYYKDMAISHRVTLQTMRRLAPDAWLSYATYTGFDERMVQKPPKFLEMIPDDAICQWSLRGDSLDATGAWTVRPMARHNIGYLYYCYGGQNADFFLDELQAAAASAERTGMEGLAMYGESPARLPPAGLSYLAFREFCFHPGMSREEFTRKRLSPLYGEAWTSRLWTAIELVGKPTQRSQPGNTAKALAIARAASEEAPPHARPHWQALADYLQTIR